jgi:radical SAM superfamily enzyme YgiQ (UPF0313 family)
MIDMLICIIPKINPDAPTVGPAVLKATLQKAGYSCTVLDLNIDMFREFEKHGDKEYFFENDRVFKQDIDDNDFFRNDLLLKYEYVIDRWMEEFKNINPKYIGMSMLSSYSRAIATTLCLRLRQEMPDTKIVWGGAEVTGRTKRYLDKGMIDYYVWGDGEQAILDLMAGNFTAPGINGSSTQLFSLDNVEIPNYDDINWSRYYKLKFHKPVYVTGSRGCVKRCTFCNVYEIWPKYTYRSGESIAKEIFAVREKYDRQTFRFTDSLINGSMKAFKTLLEGLSEYRTEHNDNFKWVSQWIIRSKKQFPEDWYRMMKEAGCEEVEIGMESFVQKIRYDMKKKFTDEDMWFCLEMLQKYKIPSTLMMIIGWPTETEEDHEETLDTVRKIYDLGWASSKAEDGKTPLIWFSFANTLMLDDTQPVWQEIKDDLDYYNDEIDWSYKGNDLATRNRRFKEVNDLITELTGQSKSWMLQKKEADMKTRMLDAS